jgi:hypothetical protein
VADRPLWRQAFDAVDRRVSGPVEAGVRTDAFADALALGLRVRERLEHAVERRTRRALHLLNLPAASDVKRLREQIAALQREVRDLSRELEERG